MPNTEAVVRELKRASESGMVLSQAIDFDQWQMLPSDVAKIRPADAWTPDVINHFHNPEEQTGGLLPWSKTHHNIRIRPGELSIWAGVNGHGKSLVLSHVLIALMKQGHSACVASLEMRPVSTLTRMARQYVGNQEPSPEAIQKFTSFASDKLYLFDQQGTVESSKMLAVLRYAREHLGVQHFVIDSLMKCGLNADDYNAQKRFIDSLSSYARDSECHIHLVAHSRKRENEAGRMDKMDVKGTSEITDMADNVYTLWRNKTKEEKIREGKADDDLTNAPDAILTMDKQRHGEWEGIIPLWFHKRSLQFLGKNKNQAIDYMTGQVNVEEA